MSDSSAVAEKGHDDSSKLKTFLSILRKFVGVADIASVRFSLPAQLLEPTPNLEYWNYLDRPETFASIGTSDDDLGRMLEVLRFWFTKDLKYIKGKPCKPYNSTLGEFFRAYWEVDNTTTPVLSSKPTNGTVSTSNGSAKVCFLTEQTSHHPPVSAFYIDCPERGISARGFDQISAKFTGTSIRVGPGQHNLGIFVNLANRDNEEYQLTHPAAHLSGLLRGSLYISVADSCYITCRKTKIKVILQYLEDGWVSKAHSRVEGVIFRYDPDNDTKTKIKDVPSNDVLARINGCWREQIYYTLTSAATSGSGSSISSRSSSTSSESNKPQLLIDLVPLTIVPKSVPPEEVQLSNESRKFWSGVTSSILSKQFSQATKLKQEIEERQRAKAAEREAKSEKWKPRFFTDAVTPLGRPDLTDDGRKALEKMFKGDFELEESQVTGA